MRSCCLRSYNSQKNNLHIHFIILNMETKVFKAGCFVIIIIILILCTYGKFWFGLTIWFGLIKNQSMGRQGNSPMYATGMCRQKGWGLKRLLSKNSHRIEPPRS